MAPQVGHSCKLYRNTATVASPTWDEITSVGDVAIPDLAVGLAELKRRGNNFTKNLGTLVQSFSLDAKVIALMDDTTYSAFKTNFLAKTVEEYAIMNGSITVPTTTGMRCPLLIHQFPINQALEEIVSHDMKWAVGYMESPSGTEVDPSFYVVP